MKKLLTLLIVFSSISMAQSQIFISEDFSSNQMPPNGWSIDSYPDQWTIEDENSAGGTAPEAQFSYVDEVGISRLISPSIDLSSVSSITLIFDHYFQNYSTPNPKVGVATRSDGGDWNIVWELLTSGDWGPETKYVFIDNEDVGSSDFQFCLFVQGNFYLMEYWHLDNIELFHSFDVDAKLNSINTPIYINGSEAVTGTAINYGLNEINSLEISWQMNEGSVFTTQIEGLSLATYDSYDFNCDGSLDYPIGDYDLKVWISAVNGGEDENPGNNTLIKEITLVCHSVAKKIVFEEFASSTSPASALFNEELNPWLETHAQELSFIKYPMSWPSPGDPYYTEEGGVRSSYYDISGLPHLFGDGHHLTTDIEAVDTFFNASVNSPAFMSLAGSHSISGTTIDITANILSYAQLSNLNVHLLVFENTTYGNTGDNGETAFHHVMMKMLPDAYGTNVDLLDREPISIHEQFDLADTFIEEFDDLGVLIFVQDEAQYIFQSDYSIENAVYSSESRLQEVLVDDAVLNPFDPDIYEYDIYLPNNYTEVPFLVGFPIDDGAIDIILPATELPGTSIIDVFAEDLISHSRYVFHFLLDVGLEESIFSQVKIYPNPISEVLHISNLHENTEIQIMDIFGRLLKSFEYHQNNSSKEMTIPMDDFENGIYFIQLESKDHSTTKKIIVSK